MADAVLAGDEDHRGGYVVRDAHRVVRRPGRHHHERLSGPLRGHLERTDDPLVERRRRQGLPLTVDGLQAALSCHLPGEGLDVAGNRAERLLDDAAGVEREPRLSRDDVDDPRLELDLADRADGAVPRLPRQPLDLEDDLRGRGRDVEAEVHRRRAGVVGPSLHPDVRVDVAGDRVDDADAVAGVLEHTSLLDVELDPAREVVEDAKRLAPAPRLVARLLGVLPERPPVVDRPELLAQLLLRDALRGDPAPEQHLPEARALLLEEGDELKGKVEPELPVQPADFERGDDAHRAVVLAAVPIRVAVRPDPEDLLARGTVARDQRSDRVVEDLEADRLQFADEVVERRPVLRRVGVAPDRLVGPRVVGTGERLDVPLDPLGAPGPVDGQRLSRHCAYPRSGTAIGRKGAPVAPVILSGPPMKANSYCFSAAISSIQTTSMIWAPAVANM